MGHRRRQVPKLETLCLTNNKHTQHVSTQPRQFKTIEDNSRQFKTTKTKLGQSAGVVEAIGALACPAWDVPLSRTFPDLGISSVSSHTFFTAHVFNTFQNISIFSIRRIHGPTHSRSGARPEEDLLADAIAEGPWEWMRI